MIPLFHSITRPLLLKVTSIRQFLMIYLISNLQLRIFYFCISWTVLYLGLGLRYLEVKGFGFNVQVSFVCLEVSDY